MLLRMTLKSLVVLIIMAIIDFAYNRHKLEKDMRMSDQDIKEEMKQYDLDPQMKGKLKEKQRQASQNAFSPRSPKPMQWSPTPHTSRWPFDIQTPTPLPSWSLKVTTTSPFAYVRKHVSTASPSSRTVPCSSARCRG